MNRPLFALLLFITLPACQALQAVESAKITKSQVVIAGNAFDAVEATATNYLVLPKCTSGQTFIKNACRDPNLTVRIVSSVKAGRTARDALLTFYKAHPDGIGASGLMDALTSSITVLKAAVAAAEAS